MADNEPSSHLSQQQWRDRRSNRLLPRLASLLVRHADVVSVISCISGLIVLLLLPALAKTTYISENALIPGSASPKFSSQDARDAARLARELLVLVHNSSNALRTMRSFLVQQLIEMGTDFYLHSFTPPKPPFSSVRFFSTPGQIISNISYTGNVDTSHRDESLGTNIVGIARAPRGEGNEAIVLVTPFEAKSLAAGDALSLGVGLTLFRLLSCSAWLAKDIIWLAADSQHGTHAAVAAWLKDYHNPAFKDFPHPLDSARMGELKNQFLFEGDITSLLFEDTTMEDFKRAGLIAAGIVIMIDKGDGKLVSDSLKIYAEGSNGQMPNLDLINVVNHLAVWRQGLHMYIDTTAAMLEWAWLHIVGQILEKVGRVLAIFNSSWKFGLPASEYVHGAATLTSSLLYQALGVPRGAEGAFRDYQVDAVTLIMTPAKLMHNDIGHLGSVRKLGRLLEGVVRSINNLLEKFHQSFFLYLLTGPSKFVSVGVYMIPLLLLIVTLPLKAAALCSHSTPAILNSKTNSSNEGAAAKLVSEAKSDISFFNPMLSFGSWVPALSIVCMVEIWAFIVAVFPVFICHIDGTSDLKMQVWMGFGVMSFCLLLIISLTIARGFNNSWIEASFPNSTSGWVAIKASTLGLATMGLGIMSLINFAAALVGAVLLVPMCLSAYPVSYLHERKGLGWFFSAVLGPFFTILGSLPALLVVALTIPREYHQPHFTTLWGWSETMWHWGSATYLYLFFVHLPCSNLCLCLMLYRER